MTNELTNERLAAIVNDTVPPLLHHAGPAERKAMAAELLAKRQEVEALTKGREEYRAVVARQVEDKRRLFAEGNEARSVLALVAGNLAAWVGKREEAPESAQEHLDEAMHALVRFQPQGGYGDAASKLRLEMWHGEVYAERDAAQAEVARLASSLAAVERQRDELVQAVDGAAERLRHRQVEDDGASPWECGRIVDTLRSAIAAAKPQGGQP